MLLKYWCCFPLLFTLNCSDYFWTTPVGERSPNQWGANRVSELLSDENILKTFNINITAFKKIIKKKIKFLNISKSCFLSQDGLILEYSASCFTVTLIHVRMHVRWLTLKSTFENSIMIMKQLQSSIKTQVNFNFIPQIGHTQKHLIV